MTTILPITANKYHGHIWLSDNGKYRVSFMPLDSQKRHSKRFESYESAFEYLRWLNQEEDYTRVKNIIYKEEDEYTVSLAGGKIMQFDEIDLELVQSHIWSYHNKGYVNCSKKDNLPSTLFHVCAIGHTGPDQEIIHLNKIRSDNRRSNIPVMRKKRTFI